MSGPDDLREGLPLLIEASLRCFLYRMENAPGVDNMEKWLGKFMQEKVKPCSAGRLMERYATPEKVVLHFLDFVETEGVARV